MTAALRTLASRLPVKFGDLIFILIYKFNGTFPNNKLAIHCLKNSSVVGECCSGVSPLGDDYATAKISHAS